MPSPIRPEAFAFSGVTDWTGGLVGSSINGRGVDFILATAACRSLPVVSDNTSSNCRMIDDLNESLVPSANSEFLKMRVSDEFITNLTDGGDSLSSEPIAEVSDCFIVLNVIGAPGTYAVRIKNDNDIDFSPWIAVGQPHDITDPYASSLFKARFIAKDHFEVPWILSPGSGDKIVTAEVLTFFGRSEPISLRLYANYAMPKYSVSLLMRVEYVNGGEDGDGELVSADVSPPRYRGYPVVSKRVLVMPSGNAATPEDVDALDVGIPAQVKKIVASFRFKSAQRMTRISSLIRSRLMQPASESADFEAVLVTRGIQSFRSPMAVKDAVGGIYEAEFEPIDSDGVLVADGISAFYPLIPSQCIPGGLVSLDVEGVDFAGLGDNLVLPDVSRRPVYIGYSDPDDRRNAFGDTSYWRQR
jgi:hypothetical protein